ncbi:MAG TPA: cupredoxin family copper-binding protein [Gemmatimonadales bacterium]
MTPRGRELRRFGLVVALAMGVVAFAGAMAAPRSPAPVPRSHLIEIRGMAFQPAELTVMRGDTVVWINRDIVPHTATASGKRGWDTGTLNQAEPGRVVLRDAGTVHYVCQLHPTMRGTLIVR